MAYRYEFDEAAARDLRQLTKRNQPLLVALVTRHIPAILKNPHRAGEKKGDLVHIRAYNLKVDNIAYRMAYTVGDDAGVVVFIAVGTPDVAYSGAARRR